MSGAKPGVVAIGRDTLPVFESYNHMLWCSSNIRTADSKKMKWWNSGKGKPLLLMAKCDNFLTLIKKLPEYHGTWICHHGIMITCRLFWHFIEVYWRPTSNGRVDTVERNYIHLRRLKADKESAINQRKNKLNEEWALYQLSFLILPFQWTNHFHIWKCALSCKTRKF